MFLALLPSPGFGRGAGERAIPKINPKHIVQDGYDRIAERFAEWNDLVESGVRERLTTMLLTKLQYGSGVLDLGCGNGVPSMIRLAERFQVTGVDVSEQQLARARQNVPGARFIQSDMTSLDFPTASFNAVTAYFSIIHVPRDEHATLFESIARWLKPGGLFVFSTGASALDSGYDPDWLGAPMYWSHHDPSCTRILLRDAGLSMVDQISEDVDEDGTIVPFAWFVALRSPGSLT